MLSFIQMKILNVPSGKRFEYLAIYVTGTNCTMHQKPVSSHKIRIRTLRFGSGLFRFRRCLTCALRPHWSPPVPRAWPAPWCPCRTSCSGRRRRRGTRGSRSPSAGGTRSGSAPASHAPQLSPSSTRQRKKRKLRQDVEGLEWFPSGYGTSKNK